MSKMTNIYKSAFITVDLGDYQNIKLYSSFGLDPSSSFSVDDILNDNMDVEDLISSDEEMSKEEIKKINEEIWISRGWDLKYALKEALIRIGKLPSDTNRTPLQNKEEIKHRIKYAVIGKSCEINVKISEGQNIKLASGNRWNIEYSSGLERENIEREKWGEVIDDIDASIVLFLGAIGKKTNASEKFYEKCRLKMQKSTIINKNETKEGEKKNEDQASQNGENGTETPSVQNSKNG